jgi:hypothetical protein
VLARDPRQLFEMFRSRPEMLEQVRQSSPQAAEAIQRGDFSKKRQRTSSVVRSTFSRLDTFLQLIASQSPEMRQQMELDRLASLDPFDPEVQRRIHEIITLDIEGICLSSFHTAFAECKTSKRTWNTPLNTRRKSSDTS